MAARYGERDTSGCLAPFPHSAGAAKVFALVTANKKHGDSVIVIDKMMLSASCTETSTGGDHTVHARLCYVVIHCAWIASMKRLLSRTIVRLVPERSLLSTEQRSSSILNGLKEGVRDAMTSEPERRSDES